MIRDNDLQIYTTATMCWERGEGGGGVGESEKEDNTERQIRGALFHMECVYCWMRESSRAFCGNLVQTTYAGTPHVLTVALLTRIHAL